MNKILIRFLLLVTVAMALSACGKTGALTLPDKGAEQQDSPYGY